LDIDLMRQAAKSLLGEHDFTSFRSSQCQAKSPVRTIHALELNTSGSLVIVSLRANAFLHHMVRNIMGALVQIGQRREPVTYIEHLLQVCDRTQGAPTFSPDGLYLTGVRYPGYAFPLSDFHGFGLAPLG
jgi:tRNA pseudouridine38-40 synthase